MKRIWRTAWLAGLLAALTNPASLNAQPAAAPAAAAAPAGAPAGAAAAAPAAAAAQPGFFQKCCDLLEECKRKLCKTPAGAMLNNMTKPLTFATGGIIPPFCPQMPSPADLAAQGVAGAAAAGKKDALEAAARRGAVRYLGTLDCRYFPDAAKALAAALRTDPSECVRYEAALVLNRGCCCTQTTIDALEACVSGMETDGNPAERSPRVRCAASIALEKCLGCYVAQPQEPEEPKKKEEEKPSEEKKSDPLPAPMSMTKQPVKLPAPGSRMPSKESVERARQTLASFNEMVALTKATAATAPSKMTMTLPAGQQSLFHILKVTAIEANDGVKAPAVQTAVAHAPQMMPPQTMPAPVIVTPAVATETPARMPAQVTPATTPREMPVMVPDTEPMTKQPAKSEVKQVEPARVEPVKVVVPAEVPAEQAPKIEMPKAEPVKMPSTPIKIEEPKVETPKVAPKVEAAPTITPVKVEEPKDMTGKVISIVPATTKVTPEKVSEVVVELAKKVTQHPSVSERHAAIRQLVKYDWKKHPMVASALITGAKMDIDPAVRVDCMRHLVVYKVTHPQVLSDLAAMNNDADTWIRQEATQALSLLNAMK